MLDDRRAGLWPGRLVGSLLCSSTIVLYVKAKDLLKLVPTL